MGGELPWGDVEMNFAQRLGLRFSFAKPGNARSKVIESAGKQFQRYLRDVPGWCGPNEQVIKIEAVQAAKLAFEREGKRPLAERRHPNDFGFLTFDQWRALLDQKEEAYNAREQDSGVMGGDEAVVMSPDEAWQRFQRRDAAEQVVGLTPIPEDLRWVLAWHRWRQRVGRNGIKVRPSYGGGTYDGAPLYPLRKREVTCFLDPELPDVLSILTEDKQVFTVPREERPGRFSPDEMGNAAASVARCNQYFQARVSGLRHNYMPPALPILVDRASVQTGQEMNAGRAALAAEQETQRKTATRARRLAAQRGLPAPATPQMARVYDSVLSELNSHEGD